MPSVSIPIRREKELIDSGRPYLKSSTKEKGKISKSQKARKPKGKKKPAPKKVCQEKSGKSSPRDMVPGHMGTQNHQNASRKRFQVKRGTFIKTPAK